MFVFSLSFLDHLKNQTRNKAIKVSIKQDFEVLEQGFIQSTIIIRDYTVEGESRMQNKEKSKNVNVVVSVHNYEKREN